MNQPPRFASMDLEAFEEVLAAFPFTRAIRTVHFHHTWRPRRADFKGEATIQAMWRYHTQTCNFSDIAQHITVDPSGMLWTGRNLNRAPASATGHNGDDRSGPFMIEVIGDFDFGQDRFDGAQRAATIGLIAAVQRRFGLPVEALRFHNEMSAKSCPGTAINRAAILAAVVDAREADGARAAESARAGEGRARRGESGRAPLPRRAADLVEAMQRGADLPAEAADAELPEGRHPEGAMATTEGSRAARRFSADEQRLIDQHVINLRAGVLSDDGDDETRPEDVEAIFAHHLPAWLNASPGRRDIVLFAHGGLVSEASGLAIALKQIPWWLANQVYPIHFVWETGLISSIVDRLAGRRGFGDQVVEAIARQVRGIWSQMKTSAERASRAEVEPGGPEGGAHLTMRHLGELIGREPGLRLHAVGHSAGSIFLARMLATARTVNVPAFESLQFLAPAISVPVFKDLLLNEIGGSGLARTLAIFTMFDADEQRDASLRIYSRSLLMLIHRVLEDRRNTPILGLERSIRADPELVRFLGLGNRQSAATAIWSPTDTDQGRSASKAVEHGAFDDDEPTMNSVLRRVLDLGDNDPIIGFPRARTIGVGIEAGIPPDAFPPPEQIEAPVEPTPAPPPAPESGPSPAPTPKPPGRQSQYRALCVGIDAYPTASDRLRGCVNDAHSWQAALESTGFAVTALRNEQATREALVAGLRDLLAGSREGDVLVFQYAGHGASIPDENGDEAEDFLDEAFCPVDFRSGALLIDDDVAIILADLPRGVNLTLFSDACHSGTIARNIPMAARTMSRSALASIPAGAQKRSIDVTSDLIAAVRTFRSRRGIGLPATGKAGRSGTGKRSGAASPASPAARNDVRFAACLDPQYALEADGAGIYTSHAAPLVARAFKEGWSNLRFLLEVKARFGDFTRTQEPMLDASHEAKRRPFLAPLTS